MYTPHTKTRTNQVLKFNKNTFQFIITLQAIDNASIFYSIFPDSNLYIKVEKISLFF